MGLRDGTEHVKVCAGSNHEKMSVLAFLVGLHMKDYKGKEEK